MGNEESRLDGGSDKGGSEQDTSKACKGDFEKCGVGVPGNRAYAAVHFRGGDQVYVLWGDEEMRDVIATNLNKHAGVQRNAALDVEGWFLIQMNGYPFMAGQIGSATTVNIKRAGAEVLRELFTIGWILVCTSNITRTNSVGSWFFRKVSVGNSVFGSIDERCLQPHSLPILSTSSVDKIHILNFPEYSLLVQEVENCYTKGIQNLTTEGGFVEIKLSGNPWNFSGEAKTEGVVLIMRLMALIEQQGYAYFGSADFKGTSDTMFFVPTVNRNATQLSEYLAVTLNDADDLRVYQAPDYVLDAIRNNVITQWISGVQAETPHRGGFEFKLNGRPWWCTGREAISARRMMIALFQTLSAIGYEHYATVDLSRKVSDKSSLIFRRSAEPRQRRFAAISPSSTDKIRLIGFPSGGPEAQLVIDAVAKSWPRGIQQVSKNEGATQIKMNGTPFEKSTINWKSECFARTTMASLMAAVNSIGWEVVSCCDVSAKFQPSGCSTFDYDPDYPVGLDCWFVAKEHSTEAAPAYTETAAPRTPAYTSLAAPSGEAPPSYEEALNTYPSLPEY